MSVASKLDVPVTYIADPVESAISDAPSTTTSVSSA